MSFNYEQSIWGLGTATLKWSDPAGFRLRQCLESFEKIPAGAKTLEVGCGAGQFIRAIKRLRPELVCCGCDISRAAIIAAKTADDGVNYDLNAENRLPYPDAYFDAVVFFDVLEHVENPSVFAAEIFRVLKPGGVLYGFVPCEGDWLSWWRWLDKIGLKNDLTKKFAGHVNYFSRSEVEKLLAENGFIVSRRRYSEHFLGQKIGLWSFFMMARAARRNGGQINNEAYFARFSGRWASFFKKIVNALIYLESAILQRVPSPNFHITAAKKM